MTKYPNIINTTQTMPTDITLSLFVSKDIVFFQGHFPQMAVLPGVAQIDWVIFFARKFFNIVLKQSPDIEHVKFTNIIKPETTLFLTLQLENNVLSFKYFDDAVVYSQGKITI